MKLLRCRSLGRAPVGRRAQAGFTLLEVLIVLSIIGILAGMAVPSYQQAVVKAREAVLQRDLFTLRDLVDQYRADKGRYPASLKDLVGAQYLRRIPEDPFTRSAATWQEIPDTRDGGIYDVRSNSTQVGLNGVPYNQW